MSHALNFNASRIKAGATRFGHFSIPLELDTRLVLFLSPTEDRRAAYASGVFRRGEAQYASPLRSIAPITLIMRCIVATRAIFFRSLLPPITCSKNCLKRGHFLIAVHVASQTSLRITGGPSRVMWPRRFLSADASWHGTSPKYAVKARYQAC